MTFQINITYLPFQFTTDPFAQGLSSWIQSAPIGKSNHYDIAVTRIQKCKNDNSTVLDLSFLDLASLPPELGSLTNLTKLYLSFNQLSSLPTELASLTNLAELYLNDNKFTSIPAELSSLTNLTKLYLNKNKLANVPAELGSLTNLTELYLSFNQLSSLPAELSSLRNLRELTLYSNQLTSIPDELASLFSLTLLNLGSNPNLDKLPMALGDLENLNDLDFEETAVPESIQTAIKDLQNIKRAENSAPELPARLNLWKAYANIDIDLSFIEAMKGAGTINLWLKRLEKTKQFQHLRNELAFITCEILTSLRDNKEFSDHFILAATRNNECCEDRSAQFFNLIYTHYKLLSLPENASFQDKLTLFLRAAKTLTLRVHVDTLIRKENEKNAQELMKANPLLPPHEAKKIAEHKEAVEIQLFVETSLKNRLNLLTAIDVSRFADELGSCNFIKLAEIENWVNEHYLDDLDEIIGFTEFAEKSDPDLATTLEILERNDQYLKNRKTILKAWAQR